jgi:ribokinase
MSGRVVVCGSCMQDQITTVDALPKLGETKFGLGYSTGFGGKGANQAVAAALLGSQVEMLARVGDDSVGASTIANFRSRGVKCEHVHVTPGHCSGIAPIMVTATGENAIVVVPGANMQLVPADVAAAAHIFEGASALLTQNEIPMETTIAALKAARSSGVISVFNFAPATSNKLPDVLWANADIVCVNETEAGMLCDGDGIFDVQWDDLQSALSAAQRLQQLHCCRAVIITLGKSGAVLAEKDSWLCMPAPDVRAVDTTGAGDCFLGTFAHWYFSLLCECLATNCFAFICSSSVLELRSNNFIQVALF